jgi:hypothetical protein
VVNFSCLSERMSPVSLRTLEKVSGDSHNR